MYKILCSTRALIANEDTSSVNEDDSVNIDKLNSDFARIKGYIA